MSSKQLATQNRVRGNMQDGDIRLGAGLIQVMFAIMETDEIVERTQVRKWPRTHLRNWTP